MKIQKNLVLTMVLCLQVLSACTGQQTSSTPDSSIFYPAPPVPARLQYLTKFSSQLDLGESNDAFRNFVFGDETTEGHLVNKPYGLAIYDGAIYVVDTRGGGYVIFDFAEARSRVVRGSGASTMQKPINITISEGGTRYVTDTQREQVLVFDRDDRFVTALGTAGQFRPIDVAIFENRIYVSDMLHHKIQVLDEQTGEFLFEFGTNGSGPGELFQPTNLAVGTDGSIYVTDTGNFRVQVFSAQGDFIRSIGQIGTAAGHFARPKGIAIDKDDQIYVVDSAFANIQILDSAGTPLLFFGGPGQNTGNINLPTVVKIDYENVEFFQKYADPNFEVEYLVLVASQFGMNKIAVFGYGTMKE